MLHDGQPKRGYFVAFFVACGCVAIGDLNTIAPLVSMFFLMTVQQSETRLYMRDVERA